MTNRHVNAIAARLSLRAPQRESLELLHEAVEVIRPAKGQEADEALERVKDAFPDLAAKGFEDFERDFPSLCFSLATGVGKTRLMGAFIAYLHLAHGIRHFFVLAPNLTIYNKLIDDFSNRTSPKYVFQGIAEFAQDPPYVVTGDNYEGLASTRADLLGDFGVAINIFNISKINSEVRGGRAPRIKRLSEYIGESYFSYLSSLPDLVLLMDESHRYRASQGVRAINELKPILGLELTATPKVKSGSSFVDFKNVVYSYPLNRAIADGFVKEPAVATRQNFNPAQYAGEEGQRQLEKLKLEDGVIVHEAVKVDLEAYARQNDRPIVKPFMLVVAQNIAHANELQQLLEDDIFFEGRYRGKVITVTSNQTGEEKDENVQRLLAVEDPEEPTEIVIHVNKLQEGWDVTNLYTIVPLRASASDILTEQTIGRGLRLPYGRRTGVAALDRLTIIAHEHFQRIIDDANRPDSIIKTGVVIGRDVALDRKKVVQVEPLLYDKIVEQVDALEEFEVAEALDPAMRREVALQTIAAIARLERLPSTTNLNQPAIIQQITRDVEHVMKERASGDLVEETRPLADETLVRKIIETFVDNSLSVPRIILEPAESNETFYSDFDMETRGINLQPVAQDILVRHLQSQHSEKLRGSSGIVEEVRLEDYIVRHLISKNDISYDDHSDLLYKLAGQVVERVQSYLGSEEDVLNVIQHNDKRLAELIYGEMCKRRQSRILEYKVIVSKGFTNLKATTYTYAETNGLRDFRETLDDPRNIRQYAFNGFAKCLYPIHKFDSDTERRFAVVLEDDEDVLKWFRPAPGQLPIFYTKDNRYEPDFVIETKTHKILAETKRADHMDVEEVKLKRRAAQEWCEHATAHAKEQGDKPWAYLLIAHDEVRHGQPIASYLAASSFRN